MLLYGSWEPRSAMLSVRVYSSVLFRVHEGIKIASGFLLKVVGDSVSCSIGEIIPFEPLYDV